MLVDLWSKHLDNRQEAEQLPIRLEPLGSRGSSNELLSRPNCRTFECVETDCC